jgi:hypothetical protein
MASMKACFDQIRKLLTELEVEPDDNTAQTVGESFSGLELPLIVQEIVDDLQPLLSPYESAFYWYVFRHSIAENGKPLLRVSTRGLQSSVVKSSRSERISLTQVRETLAALETFGAIRKEGEPNRNGTLYRVLIPDEMEACRKFRAERKAAEPKPEVSATEIDFYNVRENRFKVYERDEYKCRYCEKQLTRFTVTLDHVKPIADGGTNSFDNLVTACLNCNSRKHHRPVGDFLAER